MLDKIRLSTICIAGFIFIAPLAARAGAYADLSQAKAAFDATHSWHAVEQMSNGHTVILDHIVPDRWRIQLMPNMTEIMIGNDLYMVRNGQSMHMPMVMPQIQQMVNQNWLVITPEVKRTLRDLGMQNVGGVMLHAYSFTAHGDLVKLYLDKHHLPMRSVVKTTNGTITITYSQYNVPITIHP